MVELGFVIHQSRRIAYGATRRNRGRGSGYAGASNVSGASVVEGRFVIHVRHLQRPWIAIVEPDADEKLLVIVTVYEVSE